MTSSLVAVMRRFARRLPSESARWGIEVALVLAVTTLVLVTRLSRLEMVEIGGDALNVWEFARYLLHGGEIPQEWTHHQARFGLLLPTAFVQLFFGYDANNYYLVPLAAGLALHVGVYALARKFSGPVAGALAVVLLLWFPPFDRASSQILPELFGPTFTICSLLALAVYTEAKSDRAARVWLCFAAVLFFLGYGARISNLFFAPGLGLLIWRSGRGLRDVFIFAGILLGLFLCETAFYRIFTAESDPISLLTETHAAAKGSSIIKSTKGFFKIYTGAGALWQASLAAGIAAALWLLVFARDRRAAWVGATLLGYLVLQTFVIRRLNPLTPWMRPLPRYLLVLAPFLALSLALFLTESAKRALPWLARVSARWNRVPRIAWSFVAFALVLAATVWQAHESEGRWGKNHPFRRTALIQDALVDTFRRGLPIATVGSKAKPLKATGILFLPPELLTVNGKLLAYQRFQSPEGRLDYLLRDPKTGMPVESDAVDIEVKRRFDAKSCVLRLKRRGRFLSMTARRLPRSCPTPMESVAEENSAPADDAPAPLVKEDAIESGVDAPKNDAASRPPTK